MDLKISIGGVRTAQKRGSVSFTKQILCTLCLSLLLGLCYDIDSGDKMSFSYKRFKQKLTESASMSARCERGLALNRKIIHLPLTF